VRCRSGDEATTLEALSIGGQAIFAAGGSSYLGEAALYFSLSNDMAPYSQGLLFVSASMFSNCSLPQPRGLHSFPSTIGLHPTVCIVQCNLQVHVISMSGCCNAMQQGQFLAAHELSS
jgi:hypothetical protein